MAKQDIVARLREMERTPEKFGSMAVHLAARDAADEIERLRDALAKAKTAEAELRSAYDRVRGVHPWA